MVDQAEGVLDIRAARVGLAKSAALDIAAARMIVQAIGGPSVQDAGCDALESMP